MKQTTANTTSYKETNSQLISQIREGGKRGQKAREQLILQNQDLVRSIVYGFKRANSKIDENDLFQQGLYGLIKAIDNFYKDPECFNPYLSIEGYILNYLHVDKTIKTSYRQEKSIKEYEAAYKYDPDNYNNENEVEYEYNSEIDQKVHLKPVRTENHAESDDGEVYDYIENIKDESTDHNEFIENLDEKIKKEKMLEVLFMLTQKEKDLICKLYGLEGEKEHTFEEIAKVEGCTRQAIKDRERRIIEKLKVKMK